MTDAVFVCFGDPTECWCCGGSTWAWAAEHPWRARWRRLRRRRYGLDDGRFCSEECAAQLARFAPARLLPSCPHCGFDRGEHARWCPECLHPNAMDFEWSGIGVLFWCPDCHAEWA